MQTTYQIAGSFTGADGIVSKYREIEAAVKGVTNALKDQVSASAGSQRQAQQGSQQRRRAHEEESGSLRKLAEQYHKYHVGLREARYIWHEQWEGVTKYTEAAEELQKAEMRFKALNLGAEETAKGLRAVRDVTKEIGGVRLDAMTDQLTDLHAVFGELHEAMEFLPTAAKTQYVFGAMFGKSPEETERDIRDTMKALEQKGALRATGPVGPGGTHTYTYKDKESFLKYYDEAVRMKVLSGGRLSGRELLNFMGTAGVAGKALSPEGMRNLTFMMLEMGGGRAGTSLMSLFQSFVALRQGAGGPRAAEALKQLGLVDPNKIEWTQRGTPHIKRLLPGAIPIAELLGEDPLQFAKAMTEAIKKHGKNILGHDVDMQNAFDVGRVLSQITGRQTGMSGLASMILQMTQFEKEAANVKKSMRLDDLKKMVDESDVGKLAKLEAEYKNFLMNAGMPMLSMLGNMAAVAGPAFAWVNQHQSVVMFAAAMIPLWRVFNGVAGTLAAFRNFQAANVIISSGAAISQTGGQAATAAAQVGLFRRQLSGVPSVIGTTIALSAATGLIAYLFQLKDEAERAWAEARGAAAQGKTATDRLYGTKGVSDQTIKMMGFHGMDGQLSQFLKGDIETPFHPKELVGNGFWEKYVLGHQGRSDEMTRRMREQMPELAMPSQFAFFVDALKKNKNLTSEQRQQVMNSAIAAQPKAFEKYDAAMKAAKGDEVAAINNLIEQDRAQATAAQTASEQINKLGGAADSLSTKFQNFHFPGETDNDGKPKTGPGFFHNNSSRRNIVNDVPTLTRVIGRVSDVLKSSAPARHADATYGGSGELRVTVHAPVVVHGQGNPVEIEAAVKRGIMSAKYEMLKVLNIAYKDRRPSV
jgi:hypothetical protein